MQDIARKLLEPFQGAVTVDGAGKVEVPKRIGLVSRATTQLAWNAVFGDQVQKDTARWLLWQIGQSVGVRPASIHELYMARGRGEVKGFTVPAINIRGLTYDTARGLFRAATRGSDTSPQMSEKRHPRICFPGASAWNAGFTSS